MNNNKDCRVEQLTSSNQLCDIICRDKFMPIFRKYRKLKSLSSQRRLSRKKDQFGIWTCFLYNILFFYLSQLVSTSQKQMKRLRLFERRLNLQFADLITLTVGGSVGSGRVGSFLSFLLLSLKPPPRFCRFFYWFAVRRQSFFCHHSHLFFCKHQAGQREPVQICGGVIWGQCMLSQCTDIWTYPNCFPWLLLFILFPAEGASLYSLSSCRWCSPLSGKWLGPGPRVAVTE